MLSQKYPYLQDITKVNHYSHDTSRRRVNIIFDIVGIRRFGLITRLSRGNYIKKKRCHGPEHTGKKSSPKTSHNCLSLPLDLFGAIMGLGNTLAGTFTHDDFRLLAQG